jgi:hypothetical protein
MRQQNTSTISRFVIWEPVYRPIRPVENESRVNELLQKLGVDSLQNLQGREVDSPNGLPTEMERVLLEYNLGVLAHAYWTTHRSTESAIHESLLDQSVGILELSVRSSNCLLHAGVATVGEVIQLTRNDLMRLPKMGRTSVEEIQQKLSELALEGVSAASRTEIGPGSFSLAILMPFEKCGIPEKIAKRLRAARVNDVHDLLSLNIAAIRVRARLKPAEIQTLQTRLVSFRLRLGSHPPRWITEHLKELRAAFREDIDGVTGTEETAFSKRAITQSVRSLPTCLEEELEGLVPEKLRQRRLPVIRRVLGWDGGTGTTCPEPRT